MDMCGYVEDEKSWEKEEATHKWSGKTKCLQRMPTSGVAPKRNSRTVKVSKGLKKTKASKAAKHWKCIMSHVQVARPCRHPPTSHTLAPGSECTEKHCASCCISIFPISWHQNSQCSKPWCSPFSLVGQWVFLLSQAFWLKWSKVI